MLLFTVVLSFPLDINQLSVTSSFGEVFRQNYFSSFSYLALVMVTDRKMSKRWVVFFSCY